MPSFPRIAIAVLLASICAIACAAPSLADSSSAGTVRFVKRTSTEFNVFTESPSTAQQQWLQTHFWRMEVFSPYFDSRTSWYQNGWVYRDLYAIYDPSSLAQEHPEWIAKDASGNKLYIPWGCSNGSCPQYAADITNASYRTWWIEGAKAWLAKGYKGLWIDDVNLDPRISNSSGTEVMPVDPATGKTMTTEAWRSYMAQFTEEIRNELPGVEIVHNAIWYAGGYSSNGTPLRNQNPYVNREIASANYINIERGVNDSGITGGNGSWSLNSLLSYVDDVHAEGKGVILDGFASDPVGREYSLANYFLISGGNDAIGQMSATPTNWWSGYETQLGAPQGNRYTWKGLLRRDFDGGMVLVNPPGSSSVTVTLPHAFTNSNGSSVSSVTLGASSGAVLTGAGAGSSPPASPPPSQPSTPTETTITPEPVSTPVPPAKPVLPVSKPVPTGTTITPEPIETPVATGSGKSNDAPPSSSDSSSGSDPNGSLGASDSGAASSSAGSSGAGSSNASGSTPAHARSSTGKLPGSPHTSKHRSRKPTARSSRRSHTVRVHGRVRRATSGKLVVVVERPHHHHWTRVAVKTTLLESHGTYSLLMAFSASGRYRIRAIYLGTPSALPSQSRTRIVTLHSRRAP
jgi:hypothetical protein